MAFLRANTGFECGAVVRLASNVFFGIGFLTPPLVIDRVQATTRSKVGGSRNFRSVSLSVSKKDDWTITIHALGVSAIDRADETDVAEDIFAALEQALEENGYAVLEYLSPYIKINDIPDPQTWRENLNDQDEVLRQLDRDSSFINQVQKRAEDIAEDLGDTVFGVPKWLLYPLVAIVVINLITSEN